MAIALAEAREQRQHKRYIVDGSVIFQRLWGKSSGELVNLGRGGLLVRTKFRYPRRGMELSLSFRVKGYESDLEARGVMVGRKSDLLAIKFLQEPTGIGLLLNWLERENTTWTGMAP